MINTEDFVKRLEIILDYYSLNASTFADKIGVQRSSLSHLLSGRNKPSLDFILKIIDIYPDVDLYWILNGKGNFPKIAEKIQEPKKVIEEIQQQIIPKPVITSQIPQDLFSQDNMNPETIARKEKVEIKNVVNEPIPNDVEKIVFFYKNGTFKVFTPS